ncbi:hypothetical protein [Thalassotalea sp. ND16A]|uniref:hypothetical protein n=1 Tax=Thalassotalea sp. ND16A TaxID=1535422 RepID=UPI001269BCCF|nr:hypothetical protein [Thalassotalea sp. ND16A]
MIILDQQVYLKYNFFYALQTHHSYWYLLLLSAVIDYVTTLQFMIHGSIAMEANMVVRFLAYEVGIFSGVMVGKSLQIFAVMAFCSLSKELSRPVLLLMILINCIAIYLNTSSSWG